MIRCTDQQCVFFSIFASQVPDVKVGIVWLRKRVEALRFMAFINDASIGGGIGVQISYR
jgi:hypothetical protein